MRIVLDTNVLVSGLYNPDGAPGRIVDLVLDGRIQVLYDDRIIGEYLDVLTHPRLAFAENLVQVIVDYLRLAGERVTALPLPEKGFPDPDDLAFAEVAISGGAEALITGNSKHFTGMKGRGVDVLSPAAFLERISNYNW